LNRGDGTFSLTISPEIVNSNNWTKGHNLYLRNYAGVLRFGDIEDPKAKKMKIQYQAGNKVFSVRVPQKIVEHQKWTAHQQFNNRSGPGFIIFDPFTYYGGNTLIGVAEPKKTINNLLSCKGVTGNEATN
jgi:hypothetical protein